MFWQVRLSRILGSMPKLIVIGLLLCNYAFGQDYSHVFVFLNSKPDKAEISEEEEATLQKTHRANIKRMVIEGKMIVAGPFEGGGGIFILKTSDVGEARGWLETDPAIKANRWDIELFPVSFNRGGACLAKEPHEFVKYNFLRVYLINDIANYKMNEPGNNIWSLIPQDILMSGVFPQSDGGIIIHNSDEKVNWFGENQDERIKLEHKIIWVAKGSFCEPK